MKRLITLLSAVSIVLISCQQNLVPDQPELSAPADEVMTKSLSAGKVGPDDPVVFLSEVETNFWAQTVSLDDRFKAFEVPASRLSMMTTEALAKSVLNYPLNYLVFAYDQKEAVDLIINNSPLHQEFLSRTDAFEVLVDLYAASELDMRLEKSNYDGDYVNLSYTNTMFVEAFLGAKVMNTLGKSSVKQKLAEAVATKLRSRLQKPDVFGISSIKPLITIDEAEGLNVASVDTRSSTYVSLDIYTPWGQRIQAKVYTSDGTSTEIAQWTAQATSAYPNAIVRGPATHKYNSHSYAWHNQSTSNNVWIDNADVSKYMSDDIYVETDTGILKVFYSEDSHSAIPLGNGNYISKWGVLPLMEHSQVYCPYRVTPGSVRGYKKRSPEYLQMNLSGQVSVVKGQTYLYNLYGYFSDTDLEWEVRYMDNPTPTPFVLNVYSGNTYANIRFDDYGYYKVIVRGSRNGIEMAYGMLEVYCLP